MSPPPPAAAADLATPEAIRRDWLRLAAATMAFFAGFGIYIATFPSFAVYHLGLDRGQLGLLESLREVPGLLTALMIMALAALAEPRLAALALAIVMAGFALTGRATGFWPLVAYSVLWSIGLHIWLTVQPSLTMRLSPPRHQGRGLGLMQRFGSLAILVGLAWAFLFSNYVEPPLMFVAAGAFAALGCVIAARIPPGRGGSLKQKLLFRPQYWLYYALTMLDGGRRVVVQTFAILILVKEFQIERSEVAFILFINAGLTMAASPLVGSWADRFGERRLLAWYYGLVVLVFYLYTQVETLAAALPLTPVVIFAVIFALDNLLFTGAIGIQTYIRRLAPSEDLSPSLAMGLTMNHVAAVSVPWAAGIIWTQYQYQSIFAAGMGVAVIAFLLCFLIPKHDPHALEKENA